MTNQCDPLKGVNKVAKKDRQGGDTSKLHRLRDLNEELIKHGGIQSWQIKIDFQM